MKILFYNWVDNHDPEKRGGGVALYQRNIAAALAGREDVEATFLSSGISYDLFSARPRWERVRHGLPGGIGDRYEIVNSAAIAPGQHSFGHDAQIDHPETVACFFDFLERTGPYDIVHFNNLEGLPATALALKDRFPETRVVYMLHNYFPVCPQVNLWHQERETCTDYDYGRKCVDCLPHRLDYGVVRRANAVAFRLKRMGIVPGRRGFDRAFRWGMRLAWRAERVAVRLSPEMRRIWALADYRLAAETPAPALVRVPPHFRLRRERTVDLLNAHCDRILCVSDRVGVVAARHGIAPEKLETLYIGTREAEKFQETAPRPRMVKEDGSLTLAYLGYMRRDKGFYFLLEALEDLGPRTAARIDLVIAAGRGDPRTMRRVEALASTFRSVFWANGYAHDDLDDLLSTVDVGVVPVLWEDNLPQVAIEMHARHIPLLTSHLGGAKELGNFPPMVFEAGDIRGFQEKLEDILDGEIAAEAYWRNAMRPVSMPEHVDALLETYREIREGRSGAAGEMPRLRVGEV